MSPILTKFAHFFKKFTFKVVRIIGILLVIYVSMVFYLALTERRNAFPRAIYHNEANKAIENKAKPLSCTLNDGSVLHGFSLGNESSPILLYYPEADEDAAQFLAQVDSLPGINIVTFNYRGSAQNKGTPSEENFEEDANQIAECASQVNQHKPSFLVGRGFGAISAAKQWTKGQKVIFIDPIFDIADAISKKYGVFYPNFLVRTHFNFDYNKLDHMSSQSVILSDRKIHAEQTKKYAEQIKAIPVVERNGASLQEVLLRLLQH